MHAYCIHVLSSIILVGLDCGGSQDPQDPPLATPMIVFDCGRTDVRTDVGLRTYGRADIFTGFIRSSGYNIFNVSAEKSSL